MTASAVKKHKQVIIHAVLIGHTSLRDPYHLCSGYNASNNRFAATLRKQLVHLIMYLHVHVHCMGMSISVTQYMSHSTCKWCNYSN